MSRTFVMRVAWGALLVTGMMGPNLTASDKPTIHPQPVTYEALRLEHDHEYLSHLTNLVSQRRWSTAISFGNQALSTKHAELLDPKNRRRDDEPFDAKSTKHSVHDEFKRIQFVINVRSALVQACTGIGDGRQAAVQLESLIDLLVKRANTPVNGDKRVRTLDGELASNAEQMCRELLREGYAEEYLALTAKLEPVLQQAADADKVGYVLDCLSMIRLVQGRWDESDELLRRSLKTKYPDSALTLSLTLPYMNKDGRVIISQIAREEWGAAEATLDTLVFNASMKSLADDKSSLDRSVHEKFEWPASFLDTSLGSFPLASPDMTQAALEAVVARKKRHTALLRNFSGWMYRDADKLPTMRTLAQVAATSLIARSGQEYRVANNEAEGLLHSKGDFLPTDNAVAAGHPINLDGLQPTLASIQDALATDEAILECTVTNVIDFQNLKQGLRWKPKRYVGWLITRQGTPRFLDIGDCREVDELVTNVQDFINSAPQTIANDGDQETHPALAQLGQRILAPLKELPGVSKLAICPDGALWLIPWAAVPIHDEQLLIERCELTLLDCAISTRRFRDNADNKRRADVQRMSKETRRMLKELGLADAVIDQRVSEFEQQWDAYFPMYETSPPVVFADADFDATPAAIAQAERKLVDPRDLVDPEIIAAHRGLSILPEAAPLAGTVREAEAVMTALRKLGHSNAKLYSGVDALESVAREVQKPEILHFATHGFFLPLAATPQHARAHEPAAVALSVDDEQQRASSRRRSVFLEHLPAEFQPLDLIDHAYIRCGLLLAGSNSHDQWQQVRSADGILTALEVSMMDLRGTKLVVLSACETALGDPTIGEGVVSLRQAFQLAGARSVVASLWQVPDQQTADLMSEFFHGLQEHVAPAAALRAAQLKQLKSRRKEHGAAHPYLWAAFSVTGE